MKRRLFVEALEQRELLASVPLLSSNPSAAAKLYLDFDGHFETAWGTYSNVSTPPFSLDADAADFSAAEVAAIDEIWRRVGEDYAPFNLDVTTIDPGNQTNGVTAVVAIGGSYSDWYGIPTSGVAFTSGFTSGASNVAFVFADSLGDDPKFVGEITSHESGHLFGLRHQSVWSGGVLVSEYRDGVIMGNSLTTPISRWSVGTTDACAFCVQDNLLTLGSAINNFRARPDDHALSPLPAAVPVIGIIGLELIYTPDGKGGFSVSYGPADTDSFHFEHFGGSVAMSVAAGVGANLVPTLTLRDSLGAVVASGSAIDANLPAGAYTVEVTAADANYGNLGQYTVDASYTAAPEPPPVPDPITAINDLPTRSGAWGSINFGYGGWSYQAKKNSGAVATWTFSIPNGVYDIYATYTGKPYHASNAPYSVNGTVVRVNQQVTPNDLTESGVGWKRLATIEVLDGSVVVRLTTDANNTVNADAVMVKTHIGDIAAAVYYPSLPRKRR